MCKREQDPAPSLWAVLVFAAVAEEGNCELFSVAEVRNSDSEDALGRSSEMERGTFRGTPHPVWAALNWKATGQLKLCWRVHVWQRMVLRDVWFCTDVGIVVTKLLSECLRWRSELPSWQEFSRLVKDSFTMHGPSSCCLKQASAQPCLQPMSRPSHWLEGRLDWGPYLSCRNAKRASWRS